MSKHGKNIAFHVLKEEGKALKECSVLLSSTGLRMQIDAEVSEGILYVIEEDNMYSDNVKRVIREMERITQELKTILPLEKKDGDND